MSSVVQPVAVVGLSLRYPGFCGPAAFFDSCHSLHSRLCSAERRTVSPYLQDHDRGVHHPYRINNDLYGSIRDDSWLDVKRFRVPPSDIEGDPSPFLCLQVASEALSDYQGDRSDHCIPKERTGVVIGRGDHPHRGLWSGLQGGSGLEVIRELLLERDDLFSLSQVDALVDTLLRKLQPFPSPSISASLVSNVISGMVANRLDLQGPNFLVDAACTSTIVAIQQAVRSLEFGESDLMLVGASQATMAVPIIQMFSMLGAISKDDIQPFNTNFDGTLLSEGVGFVALKRLADARSDGDRIYSIIRGFGLASDGNDSSILAPSSRGQVLAMRNTYDAMEDIEPGDIGFLEAHATGINLGDQTELASIREVFNPHERDRPLVLGTLKSLIGHSIPASGMAALIRASYAVSFGIYPGSRCDQPLDQLTSINDGLFLPSEMSPWYEKHLVPRRAAINCFGFGGINGHLVLEQEMLKQPPELLVTSGVLSFALEHKDDCNSDDPTAPISAPVRVLPSTGCPVHIIRLEFEDFIGLREVAARALEMIAGLASEKKCNHEFKLSSSCLVSYRFGLVDRDLEKLKLRLQAIYGEPESYFADSTRISDETPDLAVMLPGEGLIPLGYLGQLARYIPSVKLLLEFVDSSSSDYSILADVLHPAWASLLTESMLDDLQKRANHHDSATKTLFIVSVAYCGLLRFLGVNPKAFVGHSTGEINALMLAGGLECSKQSDVCSVLKSFEQLYSDHSYLDQVITGSVALVAGLSDNQLSELLDDNDDLYLVSDNSPSHRLIFSVHHDIQQIDDLVGSFGGFVLPTQLDRAYHTPLFSDGAEAMRRFYSRFPMSPLTSTVYSCCSAEPYPDLVTHQIDLLARQWCQPVRFRQALLNMHRDGYRCFLELNSSKTLLGFAESTFRGLDDVTLLSTGASIDLYAIDSFASAMISLWMQGFEIEWSKWHDLFAFSEQLSLPSISRPSSAITISHELYQFSHDDYTAGWAVTKPVDTLSDRSLCNNSPPQDSMVSRPAHESAPSSNESSKASIGLDEINNDFSPFHSHQLILRRALQSIDRNTRIIIDTINRQSS